MNNGWEVDRDYGWSMDEEQMTMDEYGWKLVQNGWRMDEKRLEKCVEMNNKWKKMDRRCSKKSFSKDFGLPSTKNSTWEPNLEWRVLLLLWPNCFWKSAVCQLCANTHSMFRVPDLFWLTGAVFRNISVTHSKFSKRKKSSKTWDFGPARRNGNFSDTPGDFQKVILSSSPALYIRKDMVTGRTVPSQNLNCRNDAVYLRLAGCWRHSELWGHSLWEAADVHILWEAR